MKNSGDSGLHLWHTVLATENTGISLSLWHRCLLAASEERRPPRATSRRLYGQKICATNAVFGHRLPESSVTAGACKIQTGCLMFSYLSCRSIFLHAISPETAAQGPTARLAVGTLVTASLLLLSRIISSSFPIIGAVCAGVP